MRGLGILGLAAALAATAAWAGAPELKSTPPSAGAAPLETQRPPPRYTESQVTLEIDASAGLDAPARIILRVVLRGDDALDLNRELSALPRAKADAMLRSALLEAFDWAEPGRVEWSYDSSRRVFRQTLEGVGRLPWGRSDGPAQRFWYELDNDLVLPIETPLRPKDQDQSAPYAVAFPIYDRWVTTVRVPKSQMLLVGGEDLDTTIGAYRYVRRTRVQGDTVVMYRSTRSLREQLSAPEAELAQLNLDGLRTMHPVWVEVGESLPAPTTPDDLLLRAFDEAHAGALAKALAYADQALKAKPDWESALWVRADVLARLGRHAEAADTLAKLTSNTRDETLMLDRARALRLAGENDAALKQIAQDAAAWPLSPYPPQARAEVWLAQGDPAKALIEAEGVLAHYPQQSDAYRLRAEALWAIGRKPEALQAWESAVLADPDDPEKLVALGAAYQALGRAAEARDVFEEASQIDPLRGERTEPPPPSRSTASTAAP